jgi:hypothetical protein
MRLFYNDEKLDTTEANFTDPLFINTEKQKVMYQSNGGNISYLVFKNGELIDEFSDLEEAVTVYKSL